MTVTAKDFEFDPSTIDVSSGETTIEVTNTGAVEHSFTLDDDSVGQDVEPGESTTVTVNLTETDRVPLRVPPDADDGNAAGVVTPDGSR